MAVLKVGLSVCRVINFHNEMRKFCFVVFALIFKTSKEASNEARQHARYSVITWHPNQTPLYTELASELPDAVSEQGSSYIKCLRTAHGSKIRNV